MRRRHSSGTGKSRELHRTRLGGVAAPMARANFRCRPGSAGPFH
jgi:hypothetical protein